MDEDNSKVLQFRRKGATPEEAPDGTPLVPGDKVMDAPKDNIVLSCACGSTLMELVNAGFVVCARCRRAGPVEWRWKK